MFLYTGTFIKFGVPHTGCLCAVYDIIFKNSLLFYCVCSAIHYHCCYKISVSLRSVEFKQLEAGKAVSWLGERLLHEANSLSECSYSV